jgi:hypothetical protein
MSRAIEITRPGLPAHSRIAYRLRQGLSGANKRILGSGVLLFAALLPAVWSGSQTATIFALESALCLVMLAMKGRVDGKLWDAWELRAQTVLTTAKF